MIDCEIMGYPANPRQEFSLFIIPSGFNRVDRLDKGVLKQIFSLIAIFHYQGDSSINSGFVSVKEHFERGLVTRLIKRN
jgi:hypothetical protein